MNDKSKKIDFKITNKIKSQIQDIANQCDPSIVINLSIFDNILIVNVKEGQNKPYSCKEGFYIRMGPNSQKMKRNDILKLAYKSGNIRFDEQVCVDFDWKDFDDEKFEYFLSLAKISYNLTKEKILKNLKVLTNKGITNAGILFFAKRPEKYIITSKIRCVYFRDDKRVEILDKKVVDRGIIGNIEFAIGYIKDLVPVRFEIKTLARKEFPEYPEDAYREMIINAIIHFDYFDGSQIAIEKLKNSIIINNKGELLFDEKDFGTISEPRNRLIAELLSKTEYMEKAGTGIKRIRDACLLNNNEVKFSFSNFFGGEIKSNKKVDGLVENVPENVKTVEKIVEKTVEKMIFLIKGNSNITQIELSKKMGLTRRGVEWNLKKLKEKGLLRRVGADRGGFWEIIKKL